MLTQTQTQNYLLDPVIIYKSILYSIWNIQIHILGQGDSYEEQNIVTIIKAILVDRLIA